MDFRVLGPLEVAVDGRERELGPPQQRAVLALLLIHAGTVVSTDALLDGIWGATPPTSAKQALRLYVSRLRRALAPTDGAQLLVTRRPGYLLATDPDHIDAKRFENALIEARSENNLLAKRNLLGRALALWRGPAYAEFTYEEFAAAEIRRLEELKLEAFELQVATDLGLGHHAEVIAQLQDLIAAHPLQEGFRHLQMLALYRSGRQAEALRVFQDTRRILAEELGIEPGDELRLLEEQILLHDSALQATAGTRRHNLPTPAGAFVGRSEVVESVTALIEQERVVTITGPPGVGKTRLAIEVASLLRDRFPDGAWLVELGPLHQGDLVVAAVASAVGVGDLEGRHLMDRLIRHLQPLRLILVLDNCEHLIDAVADLVAGIAPHAPGVHVVATSREVLRVDGEFTFPLRPMAVPGREAPLAEADTYDAVRLFVNRAVAADPGFELNPATGPDVLRICAALDGLPLAIELAAARVHALSTGTIAEGLAQRFALLTEGRRGAPAHQRTLEDAVAWSYQHAKPEERRAFRRLAVFVGGWTAEDAVAVLTPGASESVMDTLTSLVDKSLVAVDTRPDGRLRYRLLDTLREFGLDRLDDEGATKRASSRHADHFLSLAESAAGEIDGPDQVKWIRRMAAEEGNLRAALEWALDHDPAIGLRLAVSLGRYWLRHGDWTEGRRWLSRALEAEAGAPIDLLGAAHQLAGSLALQQNDTMDGSRHLLTALELLRGAGDLDRTADTLNGLAVLAIEHGDVAGARRLFEEAYETKRQAGSSPMTQLINLGWVALEADDHTEAQERFTTARSAAEADGDIDMAAWSSLGMGVVAWLEDRTDTAAAHFDDAVEAWGRLEARPNLVYGHVGQGLILRDRGEVSAAADRGVAAIECAADLGGGERYAFSIGIVVSVLSAAQRHAEAVHLMAALLTHAEQHAWPIWSWYRTHLDECMATAHSQLDPEAATTSRRSGAAMSLGDTLRYAREQALQLSTGRQ